MSGSWCVAWVRYPAKLRCEASWHCPQVSTTLRAAERRVRVGDRQDVVRPVAVVALGRAGGSQPRDLAVERIEEGGGLRSRGSDRTGPSSENGNRGCRCGLIVCDVWQFSHVGSFAVRFGVSRPVDAGPEGLLDPVVALPAGVGDVVRVYRRSRVVGRKLAVRGVAAGAGGRHHQAALEEPLAVNAVLVALDIMSGTSANSIRTAACPLSVRGGTCRAQGMGTFRAKVGEVGRVFFRMACLSWQSRQAGASGSPAAYKDPCSPVP